MTQPSLVANLPLIPVEHRFRNGAFTHRVRDREQWHDGNRTHTFPLDLCNFSFAVPSSENVVRAGSYPSARISHLNVEAPVHHAVMSRAGQYFATMNAIERELCGAWPDRTADLPLCSVASQFILLDELGVPQIREASANWHRVRYLLFCPMSSCMGTVDLGDGVKMVARGKKLYIGSKSDRAIANPALVASGDYYLQDAAGVRVEFHFTKYPSPDGFVYGELSALEAQADTNAVRDVDLPVDGHLKLSGNDERLLKSEKGTTQQYLQVGDDGVPCLLTDFLYNCLLGSGDFDEVKFAQAFDHAHYRVASIPDEFYASLRSKAQVAVRSRLVSESAGLKWNDWFAKLEGKFFVDYFGAMLNSFRNFVPDASSDDLKAYFCLRISIALLAFGVFWLLVPYFWTWLFDFLASASIRSHPLYTATLRVINDVLLSPPLEELIWSLTYFGTNWWTSTIAFVSAHWLNARPVSGAIVVSAARAITLPMGKRHPYLQFFVHWAIHTAVNFGVANREGQIDLMLLVLQPDFVWPLVRDQADSFARSFLYGFRSAFSRRPLIIIGRDLGLGTGDWSPYIPFSRPMCLADYTDHFYAITTGEAQKYFAAENLAFYGHISAEKAAEMAREVVDEFYRSASEAAKHVASASVGPMSAIVSLGTYLLSLARFGLVARRRHTCFCCGERPLTSRSNRKEPEGGVHSLKAKHGRSVCKPSWFRQIGMILPFNIPSIFSGCAHNLCQGVSERMLSRPSPLRLSDVDTVKRLDQHIPSFVKLVTLKPIVWDWVGFLLGKEAKLKKRALEGRESLEAKGGHEEDGQFLLGSPNVEQDVSLFVKREFANSLPDVTKTAKPRIISSCSNEVLAFLGPYMHSADDLLNSIPGIVKKFAPWQLSDRVTEMVRTANTWRKHIVASDMNSFDRSQVSPLMLVQQHLYAALGFPKHVCDFLQQYDMNWVGKAYMTDPVLRKRFRAITFISNDGCRKTGDPHTSFGNNLFHVFMLHAALEESGSDMSEASVFINGDDMLGTFKRLTYQQLSGFYAENGLTITRGDGLEFCGGYFMGASSTFVCDPQRALFKFGWCHSGIGKGSDAEMLRAISICRTYGASGNPIFSALIARSLQLTRTARAVTVDPRKISYSASLGVLSASEACPSFTTEVAFDVRLEYHRRFGVLPGYQVACEHEIAHLDQYSSLPELLGRVLAP